MNSVTRPLLAILTLRSKHNETTRGHRRTLPFRGRAKLYSDLILEAARRGYKAFVLPWDGGAMSSPLIGYSFMRTQRSRWDWVKQKFSWPQIIYNRIPDRKVEESEAYGALLEVFQKNGCKIFNERFIDKGELYRGFQEGNMRHWLPVTKFYSKQTLDDMLGEYRQIFLKPSQSSQGTGICHIKRQDEQRCFVKGLFLRSNGKVLKLSRPMSTNQIHFLVKHLGAPGYVCQQAIQLPVWRNQKFDFRVLIQKNIRGRWSFTGWGARRNGIEKVTTHVPRGGKIGDPSILLQNVFGRNKAEHLQKTLLKELGRLAEAVEEAVQMNMGEMSMDIAIAQNEKFWFLEANSKPMKFDEPQIYRKSCKTILDYCSYLAKI